MVIEGIPEYLHELEKETQIDDQIRYKEYITPTRLSRRYFMNLLLNDLSYRTD